MRGEPHSNASTSASPSITAQPAARRRLQPRLPGHAPSGRPSTPAAVAVDNEPDRTSASTTITASASAAISGLRRKKFAARGGVPSEMLTSAPPLSTTSANSSACRLGYATSTPLPSTIRRRRAAASAAMGRTVDAERPTRHDPHATRGEVPPQAMGISHPVRQQRTRAPAIAAAGPSSNVPRIWALAGPAQGSEAGLNGRSQGNRG